MHYEMAYFVNPLQNYGYFLICANVLREKVRFFVGLLQNYGVRWQMAGDNIALLRNNIDLHLPLQKRGEAGDGIALLRNNIDLHLPLQRRGEAGDSIVLLRNNTPFRR